MKNCSTTRFWELGAPKQGSWNYGQVGLGGVAGFFWEGVLGVPVFSHTQAWVGWHYKHGLDGIPTATTAVTTTISTFISGTHGP